MIEVAQLIASIATLIVALAGFVIALARLKQVHDLTNSRMSEMLEIVKASSYAEGKESEREKRDG